MSILCAVIAATEKALGSNRWPLSEWGICCSFVYFSFNSSMLFLLCFSLVLLHCIIFFLSLNFWIQNADLLFGGAPMLRREITQMKKTRGQEWMFAWSCVIASRPASPQGCHQYPRKLIRQRPPPTFAIWGLALLTLPCAHVCRSSQLILL